MDSIELLAHVIDLSRTQTPELIATLRGAVNAGDGGSAKDIAHKLKGGALTLAATRTSELCEQLERQASQRSLQDSAALINEIQSSFEQAHAAWLEEVG